MSSQEADSDVKAEIGTEGEQAEGGENSDGPLLVAMQPGTDVPAALEVVVVTAEDAQQLMQGGEIQTVVDSQTGQVVTVAAVEEVQGTEGGEEVVAQEGTEDPTMVKFSLSDNEGVVAQARTQGSDSSDDLDSSSSEEEPPPSRPKKTPKPREFAYRWKYLFRSW